MFKLLNKTIGIYDVWGIEVEARYWMALAIGFLIFLLLFTLARLRYLYVHWNLSRTSLSFLFYGFLLALILEGFLIIGGKTFMTEVLGWKNPPKPVSTALDLGREKLVDVLGVEDEIPSSIAKELMSTQGILDDFNKLPLEEREKVKTKICEP